MNDIFPSLLSLYQYSRFYEYLVHNIFTKPFLLALLCVEIAIPSKKSTLI